jgi:hypothetical protein
MLTGKIDEGIYKEPTTGDDEDEWEDIDPLDLQRHLGVDGHMGRPSTGAGHPLDEQDPDEIHPPSTNGSLIDENEIGNVVVDLSNTANSLADWTVSSVSDSSDESAMSDGEQEMEREIRHVPVKTPRVRSPFNTDEQTEDFFDRLRTTVDNNYIPAGFGFLPGEEGFGDYSPVYQLAVGQKSHKMRRVTLPEEVWYPRFVLWVQALAGMEHLLLA